MTSFNQYFSTKYYHQWGMEYKNSKKLENLVIFIATFPEMNYTY